ncbi:MAG: type II toxin-antitoxin system HicB family antitoxin [Candidatus Diapherotrites archaeon]|nr:type II toxin-antitoxin system HicB family antitoxin [Candidatus Diapherotrites archaeon]
MEKKFSAVIAKEGKWFVSFCPELGVASQGKTRQSALKNLREAVELYLEDDPIRLPVKRGIFELFS